VRRIYQEICGDILRAEIGIEQFTMAYSCPRTIGNVVAKAKLFKMEGKEVSIYITGSWISKTPPSFSFSACCEAAYREGKRTYPLTTSTPYFSTSIFYRQLLLPTHMTNTIVP
jgi:hypothetical protein